MASREARERFRVSDKGREFYREANKRWRQRNPEKLNAHATVQRALRAGKMTKPSICEVCHEPNDHIHGHHEDYSKPLDVVWCCPSCHYKIHHKEAAG